MVSLRKLLLNKDYNYVLPGSFQNDRLEGEFGNLPVCGNNEQSSAAKIQTI